MTCPAPYSQDELANEFRARAEAGCERSAVLARAFRTPVTSAAALADLILDEIVDIVDEALDEYEARSRADAVRRS